MRRMTVMLLCLSALLLLAAGCTRGSYSIRSGSVDFRQGTAVGSYSRFNGYKERRIELEGGSSVILSTDVQTEEGSLSTTLLDAGREPLLAYTGSDEMSLTAPSSGKYWIRVTGEGHKGGFLLTWETD